MAERPIHNSFTEQSNTGGIRNEIGRSGCTSLIQGSVHALLTAGVYLYTGDLSSAALCMGGLTAGSIGAATVTSLESSRSEKK